MRLLILLLCTSVIGSAKLTETQRQNKDKAELNREISKEVRKDRKSRAKERQRAAKYAAKSRRTHSSR